MPQSQIPAGLLQMLAQGMQMRQMQQAPRPQMANVSAQMMPESQAPQLNMGKLQAPQLPSMANFAEMGMQAGENRRAEEREIQRGQDAESAEMARLMSVWQDFDTKGDPILEQVKKIALSGNPGVANDVLKKRYGQQFDIKSAEKMQGMRNEQSDVNNRRTVQGGITRQSMSDDAATQRMRDKLVLESELALEAPIDKQKVLDNTLKLTKAFNDENDTFIVVNEAWDKINNLGTSGVGAVGQLYSIMKIFDPGAAVQEGDKATMDNTSSVPGRIMQMYNSAITGKPISETVLKDIRAEAGNVYEGYRKNYEDRRTIYTDLANDSGVDPKYLGSGQTYKPYTPTEKVTTAKPSKYDEMTDEELQALVDAIKPKKRKLGRPGRLVR